MVNRRTLLTATAASLAGRLALPRPAEAQPAGRVLFQQPTETVTIDKMFSVTRGSPPWNPIGVWYAHANQSNPFRADHNYMPVDWDAGAMTGYSVAGNRQDYQRGILIPPGGSGSGRTCAQVQGGVVGAYLNSADLIHGSQGFKMMVSPQITFAPTPVVVPFARASSVLSASMDLQIPVAVDAGIGSVSHTYVSLLMLMIDPARGTRIAFQCNAFSNGSMPQKDGTNYDPVTKSLIVGAFIASFSQYLTPAPGSALFQSAPWRGWKTFSVSITSAQFASGVRDAAAAHGAHGVSTNPADYVFAQVHLNAELVYRPRLPTRMGWSMRNLLVTSSG